MEELRTYKDFADNSYQYFMFAYNSGQLFNEMGAMAQSVCERYLKNFLSLKTASKMKRRKEF